VEKYGRNIDLLYPHLEIQTVLINNSQEYFTILQRKTM
jgi:hypothetical protein